MHQRVRGSHPIKAGDSSLLAAMCTKSEVAGLRQHTKSSQPKIRKPFSRLQVQEVQVPNGSLTKERMVPTGLPAKIGVVDSTYHQMTRSLVAMQARALLKVTAGTYWVIVVHLQR